MSFGVRIRLLAALAGLAAGLAAVAVAAVLVHHAFGTSTAATNRVAAAPAAPPRQKTVAPGFPAPPDGAVVYAREDGPNVLALGVVPQRGAVLLQASVLGGQGHGVRGLRIVFTLQGERRVGTPCGAGCYRATVPLAASLTAILLEVQRGIASTRWHVDLPAAWPPQDGAAILARAGRVWRSLRSLAYVERLASTANDETTSDWRVAAPDRASYSIRGDGAAIVIGDRRWDRSAPRGRWVGSAQSAPITQPVPFWAAVSDAHVLGTVTVSGRTAWRVSFFDPVTRAWFEVSVEKRTGRTLTMRMFATAHFMHDTYHSFDSAAPIVPPPHAR